MIPAAVLLSVCINVAGCGWPSSSSVTCNGNISCAFIYNDPIFASTADNITVFIILASTDTGAFNIFDLPSLLPKYANPPARDLASLVLKRGLGDAEIEETKIETHKPSGPVRKDEVGITKLDIARHTVNGGIYVGSVFCPPIC